MRHFVLDFPYSNVGPSQLMPGENAECACQALRDIFEWLGGVPPRIVFDNAAGVGRRMFERVRLTRLFQSFQAHYGFEYVFCNAYAGHEKGGVESRVGAVRRKLFVPVPSVWSMPAFNVRLLERCLALGDKDHYRKGGRETDLFAEDRKALLALPETRFDVVTWKRMKADKYGIVTVEGRHRYAAGPEHAGREPVVGLRAFEVRAASMPPGPASRRIRAPTATTPPAATTRPCRSGCCGDRPGAWPNSQVREALPDPLREWLDGQERAVLAEGLRTLRQAERESGWANAVAAMAEILETTGGIDRAGVCLAAARHAAGTEPVAYDEPVDPTRIRPGVRREEGQRMSQRNEERTDIDRLRARARALFISQATIDDLLAWATPRQLQAVDRLLHTEPGQPRDLEARQAPAPRPVPRPQDAGRPRSSRT